MAFPPGTLVGCYEVVSMIGAGGMGEVYRARDTRLNRDVALKVLPELFTADPDRYARFTREAQTLAALNHPNIAHVHGLEESQAGVRALIMELVEGEDLSAVIARGPIPLADALAIARQIADALEAAHEHGIVHRDLKPANIKLRADGTVKVLDFGLAKAMDPVGQSSLDAMNSPTLTVRGTQMGIIVGTAAYMAPEQARGKAVDRRADIWAFGVVLFEMLTGAQAFKGDDTSEVLATVLKSEPDWRALPPDLPGSIKRLLRRCLEKDPRKRLSAIGDARLELDESDPAPGAIVDALGVSRRRSIGVNAALGLVVVAVLATVGVGRLWWRSGAGAGAAVIGTPHLSFMVPDGHEVGDAGRAPLAVSPDGQRIVFVDDSLGQTQLYLRALADPRPKALAGTEGAHSPFFSPDGEWIAFFAQEKIKKVAVGGTSVQVVAEGAPEPRGGAWARDGQIYFAPTNISGIWKVPAAGGTAVELTKLDRTHGEISHRWPSVLPDGQTLLFSIWTGPGPDERQIVAQTLATGDRRVLVRGGDNARYVSAGYLIYARLDDLFAVSWHPSDDRVAGAAPVALAEHPRLENEGAAAYDISATGTLVCVTGGAARYAQRLVWIDRTGKTDSVPLPHRDYESAWISPDGRQALVQIREGTMGLWIYDFARQTLTPIATTGGSSQSGGWTPDGKAIIYRGTRNGERNLYWRAADGTGDEQRLTKGEGSPSTNSVSPDGRSLVYHEIGGKSGAGAILVLPLDGARPATPRVLVTGGAANGQVSPDGRWLAYQQIESGGHEVYVQPFPGPGPRTRISTAGGHDVLWSRDGKELFYLTGDRLLAVDVSASPVFSVGAPRLVIHGRYRPAPNGMTPFSISPDGRRFLRVQQAEPERPLDRIDVVLNWLAEVKAAAPLK
jgi:serine/threonine-protein kinase